MNEEFDRTEQAIIDAFGRHGMLTLNAATTAARTSTDGRMEDEKPIITAAWSRLAKRGIIEKLKSSSLWRVVPKHERPL